MAFINRLPPNKSSLAFNLETMGPTMVDAEQVLDESCDEYEQGKPAGDELPSFQCGHQEVQLSAVYVFEEDKSSKPRLLELPHTAKMDENSQWKFKVKFARIAEENLVNGNITWEDLTDLPVPPKIFCGTRKLVVDFPGESETGPTAFLVIGIPANP